MHRLTDRCQNATVMTVSTLRNFLETVSHAGCKFTIRKVQRDRVTIAGEHAATGKKKRSYMLLPAYPTGWPDDASCNNLNVVLDPVSFEDVEGCAERDLFAAVIGQDILRHYENTHPAAGLRVTRCC
jgi:hypothetical protein